MFLLILITISSSILKQINQYPKNATKIDKNYLEWFLLILFNENTPISIKCNALNFIGLPPIDAKMKCLKK